VATEARRAFLREHLTRRGKTPAGTLRTVVEILYQFPAGTPTLGWWRRSWASRGDVRTALAEAAGKVSDNRLPLLVLAYAAAEAEDNLDHLDRAWAFSPELGQQWLSVVAHLGYPQTEVETQVEQRCAEQAEARTQAGDDDDNDEGWHDNPDVEDPTRTARAEVDQADQAEPTEIADEEDVDQVD